MYLECGGVPNPPGIFAKRDAGLKGKSTGRAKKAKKKGKDLLIFSGNRVIILSAGFRTVCAVLIR